MLSKADVQHLLCGGLQHSVCVGVFKEAPDLCWSRSLASSAASGRAGNLEPSWPEMFCGFVRQVLAASCLSSPLCAVMLMLLFALEALMGIFRSEHCLPHALALL